MRVLAAAVPTRSGGHGAVDVLARCDLRGVPRARGLRGRRAPARSGLGALAVDPARRSSPCTPPGTQDPRQRPRADERRRRRKGSRRGARGRRCCLGAAVLRLALQPLDSRLRRFRFRLDLRSPRVMRAAWAAGAVLVVGALLVFDVPDRVDTSTTVRRTPRRAGAGPKRRATASATRPTPGGSSSGTSRSTRSREHELHGARGRHVRHDWMRERPTTRSWSITPTRSSSRTCRSSGSSGSSCSHRRS